MYIGITYTVELALIDHPEFLQKIAANGRWPFKLLKQVPLCRISCFYLQMTNAKLTVKDMPFNAVEFGEIPDFSRQAEQADKLTYMILYTRSRITRTRLYRIIAYFEGHLPHQKSLH